MIDHRFSVTPDVRTRWPGIVTGQALAELAQWLDANLPGLIDHHDVPGVSAALVIDGAVHEACAGVTNRHTQVPVTPDTLFMIQSVTKVWTATLAMQLVDRGALDLDTPITTYLPEFRTADPVASGRITPRHLLTHTAGFEGDLWMPTTADGGALEQFVRRHVAVAPQITEPGAIYSYCSAGYGVLGRVIEVLTDLSFEQALRSGLADPLGIDEIAFNADQALAFRTAIGHVRDQNDGTTRPLGTWAVLPPSNHPAGNQLAMSARSLLAFGRLHLPRGASAQAESILSAASAREMQRQHVERPGWLHHPGGQGLGWRLPGALSAIEHGGDIIGSAAVLRLHPGRDAAVAVLANGDGAGGLFAEILSAVAAHLGIDTAPAPTAQEQEARRDPSEYLGTYRTRVTEMRVSRDEAGELRLASTPINEGQAMIDSVGAAAARDRTLRLRPVRGDTFATTSESNAVVGSVEFIGSDEAGRARFLHTGRLAPRADSAVGMPEPWRSR